MFFLTIDKSENGSTYACCSENDPGLNPKLKFIFFVIMIPSDNYS